MITMTTTPKPPTAERKQQPDKTEELIEKHLANCQAGRYKIIYDVPSENMQPLFDILSSSGWRLHSVVPAIVSATGSLYPTQFIFERRPSIFSANWAMMFFGIFCLLALLWLFAIR